MKRISLAISLVLVFASAASVGMALTHPHTINLRLGYKLVMDQPDSDIDYLSTRLRVIKRGHAIYSDTDHHFMPRSKMYPKILHFSHHDEILLQFDERPWEDGVLRLMVKNDSLVSIDTLPSFISGASDLAGDGIPRFAGIYYDGENWIDSLGIERTEYVPIIYYMVTNRGLSLDSVLTKSVNVRIYGYGPFQTGEYFQNHPPLVSSESRFMKEWKRIEHAKKLSLNGF